MVEISRQINVNFSSTYLYIYILYVCINKYMYYNSKVQKSLCIFFFICYVAFQDIIIIGMYYSRRRNNSALSFSLHLARGPPSPLVIQKLHVKNTDVEIEFSIKSFQSSRQIRKAWKMFWRVKNVFSNKIKQKIRKIP